jgi:RHS repeat-associated protein
VARSHPTARGESCDPWLQAADGTLEERRFYCQNWRADVVAVTKSDGTPIEYVRYSAYGEPTAYPVADLDTDGQVTSADLTAWTDLKAGGSSASAYGLDLDFDDYYGPGEADEDLFWESYDANLGLSGKGRVSTLGVASRVGYAGYQWDQVARAYHVRYRVYLPDIGRWTRRDPLPLTRVQRTYGFAHESPMTYRDRDGMYPEPIVDPEQDNPGFIGPVRRPSLKAYQEFYASCPAEPKLGKPDEFWKQIAPGPGVLAATYCKDGKPTVCFFWNRIRRDFSPSRDDPGAIGIAGQRGWWQLSPTERNAQIDWALGMVARCIILHELTHVADVKCPPTGTSPPSGYESGSLGASEAAAYRAEGECLTRALAACGNNQFCLSAVQKAIDAWNQSAATKEGADRCHMDEPLPPIDVK